jgi:hypothetical protein
MAGMETKLHLLADEPGTYPGRSSAFSGPGFSDMRFDTDVVSHAQFDDWVKRARSSHAQAVLDEATYKSLEQPSIKAPPTIYGSVSPGLFDGVVDRFMAGRMPAFALNGGICTADGLVPRRGIVVVLTGIAVLALLTYYKKWGYLWSEWITSVDHKKIGVMYFGLGLIMLLRGFADAIMMRAQQAMAANDAAGYLPPHHYDQIFTAHGVIMIFFVATPIPSSTRWVFGCLPLVRP